VKVLCSSVLGIEAIVVLLATSLAASNGSVSNTSLAWAAGLALMLLLVLAIGTLRRPWGLALGWVLQGLVLASSIVVGWSMAVVAVIFVVLWWLAIHNGGRVDRLREQATAQAQAAEDPSGGSPAGP
jgi:formate-dependent nitrite reductase membrane component NrfD